MIIYDVCAHSSLPTSANLALGLLKKKKKKMMNNNAFKDIWRFTSILKVLKVATNVDTNAYTVKSTWKCETAKKLAFLSRLSLRCHIARLGTFSVNAGILVGLYASTHYPYTTLVTGE